MYTIKHVDGSDEEIAEELSCLHIFIFGTTAPRLDPEAGHWWIAYDGKKSIGFCCLRPSYAFINWGFLALAGVLPDYRGQGLQKRMIRVRERMARRLGWEGLRTYTIDNPASANALMRCGYRLYQPKVPYAGNNSALYWRKTLC